MSAYDIVTPALILALGALVVYGVARLLSRRNTVLASLTALVYAISLGAVWRLAMRVAAAGPQRWSGDGALATHWMVESGGLFISLVMLVLGGLVAIYSGCYLSLDQRYEGYYPLLLLLSAGVVSMTLANDLFTLYLCTVLTSAASYVLVAFRRRTGTSIEAGFKYVIMGSMASILMLAGLGLVYRQAGQMALPIEAAPESWAWRLGVVLVGFAYLVKAAIFPGHTWLPDAHGRAPSSISALLSGVIVEAYLYVLLKVILGMGVPAAEFGWLLVILGVLNMTVGNMLAWHQTYGKRLLGYSTMAQVGYMLVSVGLGLAYEQVDLVAAGFYMMAVHAVLKGLAFLCKGVFHFYFSATRLSDLDGMVSRAPLVGYSFVIALAGLASVPPLAGFTAKLQLLLGAVRLSGPVPALVLAALLLNSLFSLVYYVPLIGRILKPIDGGAPVRVSRWLQIPIAVLAGAAFVLGVWPGPLLGLARNAALSLLYGGAG